MTNKDKSISRSTTRMHKANRKAVLLNLIIAVIALIMLVPILWIVVTSMKSQVEVLKNPLGIIPQNNMFVSNLKEVLRRAPWSTFYKNTVIVAVCVLFLQLLISIPAAYAFANFQFRFKSVFFLLVLIRLLVTAESLLLPNYITINRMGLYNTIWGIVLPNIPTAIAILMFRTAFLEIPPALKDSANIDGCGDFRYMVSIALPSIRARMVAFSITSLIYQWNAYFWPMVITDSVDKRTLSVGMAYFGLQAESASEWGLTMVAALLTIVPLIILYAFFQKQLVNSFISTGIK